MKLRWPIITCAVLGLFAGTTSAHTQHRFKSRCFDRPYEFSWSSIFDRTPPRPNGCAPPVYAFGEYIGQDPDPNIRFQLLRDPVTGYPNSLGY